MSIYSGFATRQQEQLYDSYIERMLILLQNLIHHLLDSAKPPNQFCSSFLKTFNSMKKMEQYKYLKPKLTQCLEPLTKTCLSDELITDLKSKLYDKSEADLSSRLDIQMEKSSLNKQKDLILQYESEANKRSSSFRLRRPGTTKYSSTSKSKSMAMKPKPNDEDQNIRSVVEQYLGGTIKAGLAKAQKHYLRVYKRHQKQIGDMLSSTDVVKK